MKYFGGFDPESYHHRWYNTSYYDQNISIGAIPNNSILSYVTTVNNNQAMFIPTQTQTQDVRVGIDLDEDYQEYNENNDDNNNDDHDENLLGNDYETNYNELVNKAKILIETAGADNNKKISLFNNIDMMTYWL